MADDFLVDAIDDVVPLTADDIPWGGMPTDAVPLAPDDVPPTPVPEPAESRQVRRAQERAAVKRARSAEHRTSFALTDSGNAECFEQDVNGQLAFDHTVRQWFAFDGNHWSPDLLKHVLERALASMRQRQRDAVAITDPDLRKATLRWTLKSEDHRHLVDLLTLASAKPSIAVDGTNWDRDPMVFAVANGAIDLQTSRFRDGRPDDYLTKISPVVYDATARCPRFVTFMQEIFKDHPDLVDYLQRVFGYCLTGVTTEQVFWIFWGLGANGKSTLVELLQHRLFGPYAWTMPFPTATWTTAISDYQKAELPGRRFVTASEVARRAPLHEGFVKGLTGDEVVNARQIYGRPFTFMPVAKFILRCNERPVIRDLTHAMWRRVKVVPFTQTFPIDASLASTLAAEASGILNWLLDGLRLWRTEGLKEPAIVQAETADYRNASDVLTDFLAERCFIADGVSVGGRELFAAYVAWEDTRRTPAEDRLSQKTFGVRIKERFPDIGTRTVRYSGVTLASADDDNPNPRQEK
jgi:putative DNA primase/helicase